jgi:hypothetical protein
LELEKGNIHRNPAECVRLTGNVKTPDIAATPAKRLLHEVPHQDEMLMPLVSSHFKFHYDIRSRLVIIAVYMNVFIFNNTCKIILAGGGD